MTNGFVPAKLIAVKKEIELKHQATALVPLANASDEYKAFIKELCTLDQDKAKTRAMVLTEKEMAVIASYIPHNYFNVNLSNLFLIFQLRSNKDLSSILYKEWQNAYKDGGCNRFLQILLEEDSSFTDYLADCRVSKSLFSEILRDNSIAISFGRVIYHHCQTIKGTLIDSFHSFGISEKTVLYKDCMFFFLTYCGHDDYLKQPVDEVSTTIQKYGDYAFRQFLINLLRELSLSELPKFGMLTKYFLGRTGEPSSKSFLSFFKDVDPVITNKYINWINQIRIDLYFGNDERSRFWRKYAFLRVTRHKEGNLVIMEAKNHFILEFIKDPKDHSLHKVYGTLYIFDRDTYENEIYDRIHIYTANELKSFLFQNKEELPVYHRVHNDSWQPYTNSFIQNHSILHIIESKVQA